MRISDTTGSRENSLLLKGAVSTEYAERVQQCKHVKYECGNVSNHSHVQEPKYTADRIYTAVRAA